MTQITLPPRPDFFRTDPAKGVGNVDRAKGVIYGASMIQEGDLNDSRPWRVDAVTLQQTVELASRFNRGLKARFTHPDMSNDGLGKYLGRWQNVRIDGTRVRGDLHIAKSAYETPDGNLAKYVLDMASEDPEAFGTSLAPVNDEKAMDEAKKSQADPRMRTPIRLAKLYAADIVDEPAATRGGFFSAPLDDACSLSALPAQASLVLDRFFSDATPDVVRSRVNGFLDKYLSAKGAAMPAENKPTDPPAKKEPISCVWNETLGRYELPESVKPEDFGLAAPRAAGKPDEPPPPPKSDLAKVIDNPALAENIRVREITALCARAGLSSDLANKMIADLGYTVEQARSTVLDSVLAKRVNLEPEDKDDPGHAPKKTVDDRLGAEYEAAEKQYVKLGVTKEQYISSRKIDEGLELLTIGGK